MAKCITSGFNLVEGCVDRRVMVARRYSWQIARAMKFFRLLEDQTLPIPLREAWDFFSDPGNLPRITPPWLGFEVTSEPPPRMYPGMVLTYRVRPLLGIPVSWMTEITQVSEPEYFIDEQRFGPYRLWHHEHRFEEAPGGYPVARYRPLRPARRAAISARRSPYRAAPAHRDFRLPAADS